MAQRPGQITASDSAVPKSLAARGQYDFERLEPLLLPQEPAAADTDE
jgi:hypothetical protein